MIGNTAILSLVLLAVPPVMTARGETASGGLPRTETRAAKGPEEIAERGNRQPALPATARAGFLKSRSATFRFSIFCLGPWYSCRDRLTLYVPMGNSAPDNKRPDNDIVVPVTQDQAVKIIEYLEQNHLLKGDLSADTAIDRNNSQPDAQYIMEVGSWTLKVGETNLYANLGWGLPMLDRLEKLRRVLDGRAGAAMDKVLAPLKEDRKRWIQLAAKTYRRREYRDIRWTHPVVRGTARPGQWQSGDWTYTQTQEADESKRIGTLKYKNAFLPVGNPGDQARTPWGVMFGAANRGWQPRQAFFSLGADDLKGRDLTPAGLASIEAANPMSETVMASDLVEFLTTVRHDAFRTAAIGDLAEFGGGVVEAVPCLIEMFETDGSPDVRRATASTLGRMGAKAAEAVPVLASKLPVCGDFPEVIAALGGVGPDARGAVPALAELLRDRHCQHRLLVIRTLGLLGPSAREAIPALREALRDDDMDIRAATQSALDAVQGVRTAPLTAGTNQTPAPQCEP